ncbi:lipocalin family protein [Paracidovorax citrulli]
MNRLQMTALAAVAGAGAAWLLNQRMSQPVGNTDVPEPNRDVEIDQYLGRWYEMARYENRFEKGCDNVTAEYNLRHDGLVEVINTCGSRGGERGRVSRGKARIVQDSRNAKLKVSFFGPLYVGDYWILDRAEDYSWSIVGEPSGRYLWILTRMPEPGAALRAELLQRVADLGYDTAMLRQTDQSGNRQPALTVVPAA